MIMKKFLKILSIFFAVIIGAVVLFWGGLNVAKFFIYSEYFDINSNLCRNPGLNDGFVCQGITAAEEHDLILVSGYMKDHSPSRIYVTNEENENYFITVNENGKAYDGHAGGIAYNDGKVYLAGEDAVRVLDMSDILKAENGAVVNALETVPVNNQASFAFADDNYLYVGEFHDGDSYVTEHPFDTPSGKNYAIVSRYTYDNITEPDLIYSIPNKVQGFCITEDGEMVLSTSFGLNDSYFYVYDADDAVNSGLVLDGAPVYFLGQCENEIKAPAMSEGLAVFEDEVITLFESACDKYIFGKFFFANHIVSLEF
ncbi:MAG: hypothetical protein E7660_05965 [Ruminococcaceae bacterium]|nr:hypothetical protein [Oscillospiraceae bacterium]